jgi:hypothetical protein
MSAVDEPGTLTGRDHPQTSYAAARRALGRTGNYRRLVLHALIDADMTDEELQTYLRISPNTQRPRRVELVDAGLVQPAGTHRRTVTGSWAVVWTATELGRRALYAERLEQETA